MPIKESFTVQDDDGNIFAAHCLQPERRRRTLSGVSTELGLPEYLIVDHGGQWMHVNLVKGSDGREFIRPGTGELLHRT